MCNTNQILDKRNVLARAVSPKIDMRNFPALTASWRALPLNLLLFWAIYFCPRELIHQMVGDYTWLLNHY